MFVVNGGTYNGKEYSCMFDARERYMFCLKSKVCMNKILSYFQIGIEENGSMENAPIAMLLFDVNDNLIYAENIENPTSYEQSGLTKVVNNVMNNIVKNQPWLLFGYTNYEDGTEALKSTIFMNGSDEVAEFIGTDQYDDKDTIDNIMDEIIQQMTKSELYEAMSKYMLN